MHACIHTYIPIPTLYVRTYERRYIHAYIRTYTHTNSWLQIFLLLTLLFCCRPRGTLFVAVLAGGGGGGVVVAVFAGPRVVVAVVPGPGFTHSLASWVPPNDGKSTNIKQLQQT